MPDRSARRDAEVRAEARRRARRAAREPTIDPELDDASDEPAPSRGNFLQRLFPSAPPLPDKPDPLAGFTYRGPLRPVVERLHLLRVNPLVWVGAAAIWLAARMADPNGLLGFPISLAALGAAGWFGWQRPSLYGAAAAALGYLGFLAFVLSFYAAEGVSVDDFGETWQVVSSLTLQGLVEAGVGFLTGWYGGYLRRRAADVSASGRATRRR